ncbi:hypothetical protein KP79_PYT09432 [Mizuhopecten yessoensis]|uniref:Uncharacterized protein n=1 Tax=Mizuhopecten yessoensis TaxID=6573 RepID=A0A210QNY5_MIZYE|nr:hypothetical protein KP79_PYT09432 [Mizuhopecten yessoensis]
MTTGAPQRERVPGVKAVPLFDRGTLDIFDKEKKHIHRCPVELFEAKRGLGQCNLNFLATMADSWNTCTSVGDGLVYFSVCKTKLTNKNSSTDRKTRKFRPRKFFRKFIGKGAKVQPASEG